MDSRLPSSGKLTWGLHTGGQLTHTGQGGQGPDYQAEGEIGYLSWGGAEKGTVSSECALSHIHTNTLHVMGGTLTYLCIQPTCP
jgi:hypothetical protein